MSPIYWILPPLKIHLEKQRSKQLLNAMKLSDEDTKKVWLFLDKATAWFYVSLAGFFNAIYFTYDLMNSFFKRNFIPYLIVVIILMSSLSILNVVYRTSSKRMQNKYETFSTKTKN
ncbi:hypothetical protein ID741_000882 [Enterococcus sp. AZ103]